MYILYGTIAGIGTAFLIVGGLLLAGRMGKKINRHWIIVDILVVLFLIIYGAAVYGLVALFGSLIDGDDLYLKGWALGIFIGFILYIPFAKWKKLYE